MKGSFPAYGPQATTSTWQRKRRLKNEIASSQTLLRLFGPAQCVKCERFFLELNS